MKDTYTDHIVVQLRILVTVLVRTLYIYVCMYVCIYIYVGTPNPFANQLYSERYYYELLESNGSARFLGLPERTFFSRVPAVL